MVSFEQASLTGRDVVLVTNRPDWSAAKIISLYSQRWPTETLYQDGKGHLGCNEYRMRSAVAMGQHWGLVFVAYSLLHLTCLPAGPGRTWGLLRTMGDACRQQGARCGRSCWSSSMTGYPWMPRLTRSVRRYLPNTGAWSS